MNDSVSTPSGDDELWARLTDKHRACLDLLLQRMTSKKIARELGISKDTADQRLTAARNILGTSDRDETAIVYARLKSLYDRVAYDPVRVATVPATVPPRFADGGPANVLRLGDSAGAASGPANASSPSGKIWRPDHGGRGRVLITVAMLFAAVILIFLGLGIAQSLTHLLSS